MSDHATTSSEWWTVLVQQVVPTHSAIICSIFESDIMLSNNTKIPSKFSNNLFSRGNLAQLGER